MDCAGNVYHSDLNNAAVYKWNAESDSEPVVSGELVAQDTEEMWWTDTCECFGCDFALLIITQVSLTISLCTAVLHSLSFVG